jgi:hypothetical protein
MSTSRRATESPGFRKSGVKVKTSSASSAVESAAGPVSGVVVLAVGSEGALGASTGAVAFAP